MKTKNHTHAPSPLISMMAGLALAAGTAAAQTTVFFDDFENGANDATLDRTTGGYSQTSDVLTYTIGNTSTQTNSTLWVRSTSGFGATRSGLIDASPEALPDPAGTDFGNFTPDAAGPQAYGFRYTNSGLTTKDGVIGTLAAGMTITVSFDVCIDGYNAGTPYDAYLVLFDPGAPRNAVENYFNNTAAVLATASGNATLATYESKSFSYTVGDAVLDNNGVGGGGGTGFLSSLLGKDVAVRFDGATSSANIDNVKVEVSYSGVAHWDTNGSTAGSGGATPTGTWDAATTNWNPEADGTGTVAAWSSGIAAVFAAGDDATGIYSVTVDGVQDIGGLYAEEGSVSLVDGTSGGLNMTSSSLAYVASGSELNIGVPLTDATGAEVLSKDGPGTLILDADNSAATGGMVLDGGVTRFDDSLTSISGSGANVLINGAGIASFGGTFLATDIPAGLLRVDTASTGTIAPNGYETTDFDFDTPGLASAYFGPIGTVNYTGTLTPAGTTYRFLGGTGGTLTLNSALTATNALDVKGPGTLQFNGFDATMGDLTWTGSPVLQNGSATTDMTLTFDLPSNSDFFGTFEDGGAATLGLTKNGGEQLTLRSNNSFTGDLTINGGTLQLGSNADTGSLNGGSYPGNISIAAGSTFRDRSNNTVTMSGVISGDGDLHQDGSGTMTLTGANTYTGQTIIRASGGGGPTLSVSSLNSVTTPAQQLSSSLGVPADAAAGTILLGSTGNTRSCTLIYTGPGETTDRVMNVSFNSNADHSIFNNGSGLLKFTSTFTINPSSGSATRSFRLRGSNDGEIAGGLGATPIPGILRKYDAGTWTLGGDSTADTVVIEDTGALIVNGTLTADNATTPTISVIETATLGGSGTVTGDVTVAAGASLTPGASVGTLDIAGTLNISAPAGGAGLLNFELGPIASSDQIAVTGALDIGSGALGLSDFNLSELAGLENGTYTLISSGGLTGSVDAADKDGSLGLATIELQTSGNNVVLAVSGLAGGSAYDTWAGGAVFTDDDNGDGVTNGLAFLLGAADPSEIATDRLPAVSESGGDLVLTFNCLPTASRGTAVLNVEHSSDLGITDAWAAAEVPDTTSGPVSGVSFVVGAGPVGPPALNSVTATIDSAEAAAGKLFGRLQADQP